MTKASTSRILQWDEDGVPISVQFGDPYFSRNNGQAETQYVFLDGNALPQRWMQAENFTIAELGFGTGLNFVETFALWFQTRKSHQTLSYVSCEAFPLEKAELSKALGKWTDRKEICQILLNVLPETYPVQDEIVMQVDDQTTLTLLTGDANKTLPEWRGKADSWFLDGFSPDKNADLWSAELMALVYHHTKDGGTCATYTAAGWVRRNLEQAGFMVTRRKGHGHKRHMTTAKKPS